MFVLALLAALLPRWLGAHSLAKDASANDALAEEAAMPPPRLALVIGNADYPAARLPTAANDAGLMAVTLMQAGFDVTAAADANAAALRRLVQTFAVKAHAAAGPNTIIVTYIAGYGLQADGDDFLVPLDAQIARDVDVPAAALPLSDLSRTLDAIPAKARIYIYDLARDAPFAKAGAPLASGLSVGEPSAGSLVAFNTAPGTVAPLDLAIYGTYARVLADLVATPGLPVAILFDRLRLRVAQISNGSVVPWDASKLDAAVTLVPGALPADVAPAAERPVAGLSSDVAYFLTLESDRLDGYLEDLAAFPGDPLSARVQTMIAARRDALIWAASVKADTATAYWTYMRRYPRGPHLLDARRRLARIHAALEPPPRFDLWNFGALGVPGPEELALLARHPLTLDDPDGIALPPLPDGLIPPPPPDMLDLSVPQLAAAGTLPLPMPLDSLGPGSILQPFVPGLGDLLSRPAAEPGTLETIQGGALIWRSHVRHEPDKRIVVTQRDAHDAIISRTVTTPGSDLVTTIQTGPAGGILRKVVTRTDSSGAHAMTISNGSNQMIATLDRDKSGVVTDTRRGAGPVRDQTIAFEPGIDAKHGPRIRDALSSPPPPVVPATMPASAATPSPPPELKVEVPPPPPPVPAPPAAGGPAAVDAPIAKPASFVASRVPLPPPKPALAKSSRAKQALHARPAPRRRPARRRRR